MKKLNLLVAVLCYSLMAQAQTDTTVKVVKRDTMRIGNILIIKKSGDERGAVLMNRKPRENRRVTTNFLVLDFGFSNYNDKTDYTAGGDYLVNNPAGPALTGSDFKLRTGKSVNVNLWFFMQRVNLIKNNVSMKYGLGFESNNYRYKSAISYKESGIVPYSLTPRTTADPFVFRDSISFSKNKLAADYLTIPLMLTLATNKAYQSKGVSMSFGVSAGYLTSQRNKQKSGERGKEKNKGEYDMERFKLSYVGELGLGPVKLYGSYSPKSIYERTLDIRPFNVGIRLGNL